MTPSYLVDTDWIIDHFKGVPSITRKHEECRAAGLAMSVISLAEPFEGVYGSRDPDP